MQKQCVRISLANHRDAESFLRLEAKCFEMRMNRNTMYFWTPAVSYLWSYKAEINGKIVGGIIAMPTRDGSWYINSLFVHPSYRKHGIATRLVSKIIRIAGTKKIILDTFKDRPYLLDFYSKRGFRIKKSVRNYYKDGENRYLLERT